MSVRVNVQTSKSRMSKMSLGGMPEITNKPPIIEPESNNKEYRSGYAKNFLEGQFFGMPKGSGNNVKFLQKAGLVTAYDGIKRKDAQNTTLYDSKRVEASKELTDDEIDYDEEADDIMSTEGRQDYDDESIDSTKQRLTLYKNSQIHSSQVKDILLRRNYAIPRNFKIHGKNVHLNVSTYGEFKSKDLPRVNE